MVEIKGEFSGQLLAARDQSRFQEYVQVFVQARDNGVKTNDVTSSGLAFIAVLSLLLLGRKAVNSLLSNARFDVFSFLRDTSTSGDFA